MSFLLGMAEVFQSATAGRAGRARKDLPKAKDRLDNRSLLVRNEQAQHEALNSKLNATISAVNAVQQVAPNQALMIAAAQAAVDTADADLQTAQDDQTESQAFDWQFWRDPQADRAALDRVGNARAALEGAAEVLQAVTAGGGVAGLRRLLDQQVAAVNEQQATLKQVERDTSTVVIQTKGLEKATEAPAAPTRYKDVPYGLQLFTTTVGGATLICGQNANVHIPGAAPVGCILWFGGGGWAVANKDSDGNDEASAVLAKQGYLVVNANYRQATDEDGPGPFVGQGGYFDDGSDDGIFDAMRILRFLISPDAEDAAEAAAHSSLWVQVRALVAEHGLMVAGVSAGGYMTMHATLRYGTATGNWPQAAFNLSGPADVTYLWGTPTDDQRFVTVNYFRNYLPEGSPAFEEAQQAASPQYRLSEWADAFAASAMEFHFGQNTNDTVVYSSMLTPFIEQLRAIAPDRVHDFTISEFWPAGATAPTPTNHNLARSLDRYIEKAAAQVYAGLAA